MCGKLLRLFAFSVAMAALSSAASADCAEDITRFEKAFDARLETERSELGSHPLVLVMADGRLVDVRGDAPDAKPTERWFVTDRNAIEGVRSGISEARDAFDQGDMAGCESRHSELQQLLSQ